MDKNKIYTKYKKIIASEFNCDIKDFDKNENIITDLVNIKMRNFINEKSSFKIISLGNNAVISTTKELVPWFTEFSKDKIGHNLFNYDNLKIIDNKLKENNIDINNAYYIFLPIDDKKDISIDYKIKWYEKEEITPLYEIGGFPNAICNEYNENRPDVLILTALDKNEIIAMAGCTVEGENLWQIGIDVKEDYKGKGIGTYLVRAMKEEVIKRGHIPIYSTSVGNMYSWNTGIKCGFYPISIEIFSKN